MYIISLGSEVGGKVIQVFKDSVLYHDKKELWFNSLFESIGPLQWLWGTISFTYYNGTKPDKLWIGLNI